MCMGAKDAAKKNHKPCIDTIESGPHVGKKFCYVIGGANCHKSWPVNGKEGIYARQCSDEPTPTTLDDKDLRKCSDKEKVMSCVHKKCDSAKYKGGQTGCYGFMDGQGSWGLKACRVKCRKHDCWKKCQKFMFCSDLRDAALSVQDNRYHTLFSWIPECYDDTSSLHSKLQKTSAMRKSGFQLVQVIAGMQVCVDPVNGKQLTGTKRVPLGEPLACHTGERIQEGALCDALTIGSQPAKDVNVCEQRCQHTKNCRYYSYCVTAEDEWCNSHCKLYSVCNHFARHFYTTNFVTFALKK